MSTIAQTGYLHQPYFKKEPSRYRYEGSEVASGLRLTKLMSRMLWLRTSMRACFPFSSSLLVTEPLQEAPQRSDGEGVGAWQAYLLWTCTFSVGLMGAAFHSMVTVSIAAAMWMVSYVLCTRISVRYIKQGKCVMLAHSDLMLRTCTCMCPLSVLPSQL